ncbi:MAG: CNNM domain-containing protein [Bacillota bacterium]
MKKLLVKSKNTKWVVSVVFLSFFLSILMTLISEGIMNATNNVIIASIVVFIIILLNIFFDILGTAVTAAQEEPLNSMASRKIRGSKLAIKMLKNADRVSNLSNDVIGDICGIVSGAGAAAIIAFFEYKDNIVLSTVAALCVTGIIASITIGGKAVGKTIAIKYANNIVFDTAKFLSLFHPDKATKITGKEKFNKRLKRKDKNAW